MPKDFGFSPIVQSESTPDSSTTVTEGTELHYMTLADADVDADGLPKLTVGDKSPFLCLLVFLMVLKPLFFIWGLI